MAIFKQHLLIERIVVNAPPFIQIFALLIKICAW